MGQRRVELLELVSQHGKIEVKKGMGGGELEIIAP